MLNIYNVRWNFGLTIVLLLVVTSIVAVVDCRKIRYRTNSTPTPTPKPDPRQGPIQRVLPLNEDNIDRLTFVGRWLILFHDPELDECQEALEALQNLSVETGINAGEVDCTKQKDLCLDYSVRGKYPKLLGIDYYMTVPKFFLPLNTNQPITNVTLMQLWDAHISRDLIDITPENEHELYESSWIIAPYLSESLATQSNDGSLRLLADFCELHNLKTGRLDCWNHSELCEKFKFTTFPRVSLFHQGKIYSLTGDKSKNEITQFVYKALKGKISDDEVVLQNTLDLYNKAKESQLVDEL